MSIITVTIRDIIVAVDTGMVVFDSIISVPILIASVTKPVKKIIHIDNGVRFW